MHILASQVSRPRHICSGYFGELKSTVFKRYDGKGLFVIMASDMVPGAKTSPPQSCHADLQLQESIRNAHPHERHFLFPSCWGICNAVNRMRRLLCDAALLD